MQLYKAQPVNYARDILRFPDPRKDRGGWFCYRNDDVVDVKAAEETFSMSRSRIQTFRSNDLFEKGERIGVDEGHWWRVEPAIYDRAAAFVDNTDQDTLSCGHTAIRNVRDGGFECAECGTPTTEHKAREVVQG